MYFNSPEDRRSPWRKYVRRKDVYMDLLVCQGSFIDRPEVRFVVKFPALNVPQSLWNHCQALFVTANHFLNQAFDSERLLEESVFKDDHKTKLLRCSFTAEYLVFRFLQSSCLGFGGSLNLINLDDLSFWCTSWWQVGEHVKQVKWLLAMLMLNDSFKWPFPHGCHSVCILSPHELSNFLYQKVVARSFE